jgi:hypothetical protein
MRSLPAVEIHSAPTTKQTKVAPTPLQIPKVDIQQVEPPKSPYAKVKRAI